MLQVARTGKTFSHFCRWSTYIERHTYVCSSMIAYSLICSIPLRPRHEPTSSRLSFAHCSRRPISATTAARATVRTEGEIQVSCVPPSTLSLNFFTKSARKHSESIDFLSRLHRFQTASAASRCLEATVFSFITLIEVY